MRRLLLPTALISLLLLSPALADDDSSRRRVALDGSRRYYEEMLRDSKTETAAQYFVDRLGEIAEKLRGVEYTSAATSAVPRNEATVFADVWLRQRISKKVAEKDTGLSDVVAWTRRELLEELWEVLARHMGARKPATREFTQRAWAQRVKSGWGSASYGSGTYIVTPARRRPPRKDRWKNLPDAVQKKMGIKLPKPPTRDQWWAQASNSERVQWTLAFFVENSGLFEVAEEARYTKCVSCTGEGHQVRTLPEDITFSYLCHRCAGVARDKTVRYR